MDMLVSIAVLVVIGFIGYRVYKSKQDKPTGTGGGGGKTPGDNNTQLK